MNTQPTPLNSISAMHPVVTQDISLPVLRTIDDQTRISASCSRSVAMVSTYPPLQCGLATFAAASRDAIQNARPSWHLPIVQSSVSVDNETPIEFRRSEVRTVWRANSAASLIRAGHVLSAADCIIVQHEYGIFGGNDGCEIIKLLDQTDVPAIAILHTVLNAPSLGQRQVVAALGRRCASIVVMSESARQRLLLRYLVPPEKVVVIPHGAHPSPFRMPLSDGATPRLLTWGLVGPGKGLERAIDAVAILRSQHVDLQYSIVGETHPNVRRRDGESYFHGLITRTEDLGVADCVTFDPTYRTVAELVLLVAQADVVVIPYDTKEQVTSGVLVEALAAGKPIVATNFPHASETLRDGAGIVVDHDDPAAMAQAIFDIIRSPQRAQQMSAIALREGARMLWPVVGESMASLVEDVLSNVSRPRTSPSRPSHKAPLQSDSASTINSDRAGCNRDEQRESEAV
jgi:polysaccharide biosynthesis protein PslF